MTLNKIPSGRVISKTISFIVKNPIYAIQNMLDKPGTE